MNNLEANRPYAACTIISRNYLAFARVLARSFHAHHPGQAFFTLLVDRKKANDNFANEPFEVLYVEDIGVPDFLITAFRFDILELNTNVKPTLLKYLFRHTQSEKLIYVDPDIYFFRSASRVFDLLDTNSMIVTPHCVEPIHDSLRPSEQDFLKAGVFNLGFIALRKTDETLRMLDWWENRCLSLGFNDVRDGLFVDQCWINFLPCFFDSVLVLKDRGYNMAYWNLHERELSKGNEGWLVNGHSPLVFFHFSGIELHNADGEISRYQNRFSLASRTDLAEIFSFYRREVLAAGYDEANREYRYSFGFFSDGTPISLLSRRICWQEGAEAFGSDPFSANGELYLWAKQRGLLGKEQKEKSLSSLNYNKADCRLQVIHSGLRLILRVFGVGRYLQLMKYLSFISILRNQKTLFK